MIPDKKIISFDLDGTLTPSKSPITKDVAILVKELVKKVKVVVISGGKFGQFEKQFLREFFDKDFLDTYFQNLILLPTSGSQRFDYNKNTGEWKLTDKVPLDEKVKQKARKLLEEIIASGKYDVPPNPYGEIIEDRDTQLTFSGRGQLAPIVEKDNWDPTREKREKIKAVLEPELPEASILINAYSSIDILPRGFNKGVGLVNFLNKEGLHKDDLLFVGDGIFPGGNDYSVYEADFDTISVKGPEETAARIKEWVG